MIRDYQQPILKIRLPGDGKPETVKPEADRKALSRRESGQAPTKDPYVRIVAGETAQLQITHTRQFQALPYLLEDRRLTWTLTSGAGSISAQGLYTAPQELPQNPYVTIRAASTVRPDLYDERTFRLTNNLQRISLRLVNCGLAPVGGVDCFWRIHSGGPALSTNQPLQDASSTLITTSTHTVDVSLVTEIRLDLVFQGTPNHVPGVRFYGQALDTFIATKLSDTLYEVRLCPGGSVGLAAAADQETYAWTYFNTQQSHTAHCSNGNWYGTPRTVTKAVSLFNSTTSPAAADALAVAAATTDAEALLVCMVPTIGMSADALNANGKIRVSAWIPNWYGNVLWTFTIGSATGNTSGGTLIKAADAPEEGDDTPYSANNIQLVSTENFDHFPAGYREGYAETKHLDFYFHEIDDQWGIGNADGPTWLLPVTIRAELTDPDPHFVKTITWKKFLLI